MPTRRSRVPSPQQLALLEHLLMGEAHGYDLMKATGLGPGTLYGLLKRLFDEGLLERESSVVEGRNRISYALSATGRRYAERKVLEGEYETGLRTFGEGWEGS